MRKATQLHAIYYQTIAALVTIGFSGCSFVAPSMQTIQVTSSPSGANVIAAGQPVGQTPLMFEAHRGDNLLLEVRKSGYQTQYRTTSRTLSGVGIVDVVGGFVFLLPLIGLLSSGAWKHDPGQFGIILEPDK